MRIRKLIIGLLTALVLLVVVAALLLSVLHFYYKPILENIIGQALGADVKIGSIHLELQKHILRIDDFKLGNPAGFTQDETIVYVPQIIGEYNQETFMVNKKLRFTTLDIYVKTMVVIKNKDGKLNVEQLAIFKENFQEIPIQIDQLVFTADNVIFKDVRKDGLLHIENFNVNIRNQTYKGLPSLEDITAKIMSEMLKRTTIKGAKILGTAALMGSVVGGWSLVIPAQVVRVMSSKSGYEATFDAVYEDVYKASLETAHELGRKIYERKDDGIIQGYLDDADVIIKITKKQPKKTDVCVSAKRRFLPKLNIAGGVLYEIAQKLKEK